MPFVAFPHQFNDPVRLRQMLQTIDRLVTARRPIDDDNLGYTLFLDGQIRQRTPSRLSRDQQLALIRQKPREDQSPLTIARDVRRLFLLTGMIEKEYGDRFHITQRGSRIVNTPMDSQMTATEKKAWLEGLLGLVLPEDTLRNFHPFTVMLALLSDGPIDSKLLTFAFAVADESDAEITRVKTIVSRISSHRSQFSDEIGLAGITESNARNSVKILPALAEHLGLISRSGGVASLTPYGRTVLDRQRTQRGAVAPPAPLTTTPATTPTQITTPTATRAVTARREPFFRIVTNETEVKRNWAPEDTEEGEVEYDAQDEAERQNRLRERTTEHQNTLARIMGAYLGKNWRMGTGNFDLLTEKGDIALLHEVKTLKQGDISDERLRIIDAIGKLIFYETFDVPSVLNNKEAKIQKVLVFSRKPNSQDHIDFLSKIGIWAVWLNERNEIDGEETAKDKLQRLLT
jgi:hypothetical protein